MAIETVVAGAYTGTWNSIAIGMTRNGFTLSAEGKQEVINQTDLYGDTIIDLVYRGRDTYLEWVAKVWRNASPTLWWPWGATIGTIWTVAAPIARLGSAVAQSLVLTAVANTPAASKPATLTASKAILAPGFNASLLFDSRCRDVPLRMLALPTDDAVTAGAIGNGTVIAVT